MSHRLPQPAPRDEFRVALRAQLVREAPSALLPRPRAARWWRPLAGAVATVTLVVAANTAAAQSLPGEATFVIKRTFEEARLLFAFDERTRVELLTDHASARLVEVQRAARSQPAATIEATGGLAQALGRLADEVDAIKRAALPATGERPRRTEDDPVSRAEEIAREQAEAIEKLLPAATGTARASLERAVEQTRKIRSTPAPKVPRAR